jgi:hypothetical protein
MSDPKKDQSQYRHPWRNEEEENETIDTNVQKNMIVSLIANILRKRKTRDAQTEESEEE